MIGFKLKAEGSNGFRYSRSLWTEGSMIALKIALSLPKVNPSGRGGFNRGVIRSIEASFNKIAKSLFNNICSDGLNFTLFVTGDMKFKYVFDYSKKPDQIKSEFLHLLASTGEEIGDQVLIHLCRSIEFFFMHNIEKTGRLILNVDIDL